MPRVRRSKLDGEEAFAISFMEMLLKAKTSVDMYDDHRSPLAPSKHLANKKMLLHLQKQKVRSRLVTEISVGNLAQIRSLASYIEVRHLSGIKGNFVIIDQRDYLATAFPNDSRSPLEFIRSEAQSFVEHQQFVFQSSWNKAIPADQRIREIEEGIPIENTEIVQGIENIVRSQLEGLSSVEKQYDACTDRTFPTSLVSSKIVWDKCLELQNRGVNIRCITEITPDNIDYCKKMTKRMEVRHLDSIRGNFSIGDKKVYRGAATMREGEPPTQGILSSARVFVDQQQYFFETLWNKAIPADQRIREIEEGITPEIIETFSDPAKTQQFAIDLAQLAEKELLIMFASANEYRRQNNSANGFLKRLSEIPAAKKRKLNIRITLPNEEKTGEQSLVQTPGKKLDSDDKFSLKLATGINLRRFEAQLSTRITIIIVDRKYALVVELKNDLEEQVSKSSSGLAIYSNSKAIVLSYVSIFELLWTHIELYEELKVREVAQNEFINIAVHEIRTPIQPILGLAEEIQARQKKNNEGRLLGIILKSASNLQRLADNLLDVARIQNNRLGLTMTHFDLNELIASVLADYAIDAARNKSVSMTFNPSQKLLPIDADKDRLHQVLSNCLQNALKFTETGSIVVSANKTSTHAFVSIRDSGRGIDPEILSKLFTKFATSAPSTGTGLGLFISRRIIEAHGGQITGENNTDQLGATFTFSIPLKISAQTGEELRGRKSRVK